MSGFWGMRCVQVMSIAPSGVNVALTAANQRAARGVPPAGGTTSAVMKAEEKGPISLGKEAAERD